MNEHQDQNLFGLIDKENMTMVNKNYVFDDEKFDKIFCKRTLPEFTELFRNTLKIVGFERALVYRTMMKLNTSLQLNEKQQTEFMKIMNNLEELIPVMEFSEYFKEEETKQKKNDR